MSNNDGYYGTQQPNSATDEYNATAFIIRSILNGRNFAALVKVVAIVGATVDVHPLVNQLDGQGNAVPHGVVNDLPYVRIQGGDSAIIINPKVGDIGVCVFCDRDISSVQATRGEANPGSARRSDMADGVYIGGLLNGVPLQYVRFDDDGITIHSPTKITMNAPQIDLVAPVVVVDASVSVTVTTPTFTINGDTQLNGNATATGTITAPLVAGTNNVTFGGKSGTAHTHGGVSTGTGTSGPPT